jgi:uncharacterized protein (DUF983 family)
MPPKMNCPVCGSDMRSRSLLSHYSLKPYRVCPDCNARYTADSTTKKRMVLIFILTVVALSLAVAARLKGYVWGVAAVLWYVLLWVYIGHALSKVSYVRYDK